MKRTVRDVAVTMAAVAVLATGPAAAVAAAEAPVLPHTVAVQQNDDDRDQGDQNDDQGLWGLLGLLGLVGLLGLIRRGRSNDRLAGPSAEPPVTESDRITRRPAEQPPMRTATQQPQQYADPQRYAGPPQGYQQP
jgi:MYXO-CTERM domain-containing protein